MLHLQTASGVVASLARARKRRTSFWRTLRIGEYILSRNRTRSPIPKEQGETRCHPTQKPVALATWFVGKYCPPAAVIWDGFLGSGTTMVAAEQLGRICYGMEIEPKYVAVALERLSGMGLEPKLTEAA